MGITVVVPEHHLQLVVFPIQRPLHPTEIFELSKMPQALDLIPLIDEVDSVTPQSFPNSSILQVEPLASIFHQHVHEYKPRNLSIISHLGLSYPLPQDNNKSPPPRFY